MKKKKTEKYARIAVRFIHSFLFFYYKMAKTVYIVEVTSGSDRQKESLAAVFETTLTAFIYSAKQQHQKNDVTFMKLNEEVKPG